MVLVRDGQEFLPGIPGMASAGPYRRHTVFVITSQGKTLCNAGDIAHHHTIMVENPRREFAYDTTASRQWRHGCAYSTCWRRSVSRP